MAYEAQLSIPDESPFQSAFMHMAMRVFKHLSFNDVCQKRKAVQDFLNQENVRIEYFNGGGTGTIHRTVSDASVTEITIGSGFLQSQLFDYFSGHVTECAFAYGLCVTRTPCPGTMTCQSGGFIASGPISPLSAPTLFLPPGLQMDVNEGFGEVQTPIHHSLGTTLKIGDMVFLRPAKAGEIAERFNEYVLVFDDRVRKVLTYRGEGKTFY